MFQRMHKYSYFLLLLLLSNNSFAEPLSLDSFVGSILKNNPGVQKILAENEVAAGTLEASLGVDDAILGSSFTFAHSEPNQIQGSEAIDTNNTLFDLSYDRTFSDYGTRVSLGYSNQYTERSPALSTLGSDYYQPSFTMGLLQPLLKNARGIQDKLNIKVSNLSLKLARLSSKESLESYITQLATLYVDWYLAAQELAISKEVYEQVLAQVDLTKTKVERQVIESYELLRVQETKEDYYSRLQQAKGRFEGLTQQIRYQMNAQELAAKLEPVNPKTAQLLQEKTRKAGYLREASRLKDILANLEAQQLLLLDAKSNAKKSDLNLNLAYTRHGVDKTYTADADNNDVSLMLRYTRPLGNRTAKGNFAVQIAKQQQVKADTKQRLINAEANLANLQAQASHLVVSVASTKRKIALATKKIKQEQQLFEIGNLDLFELLKDQATQLESRLAKERLYAQLLTLQLNIGELLDLNLKESAINE